MCKDCRKYITETKVILSNGSTDSNCNSILFVNTGVTNVTIDGLTLVPNQSWEVSGNRDEINVKTYYFTFASLTGAALTVIYKRYL
jgi:hypothetical protein